MNKYTLSHTDLATADMITDSIMAQIGNDHPHTDGWFQDLSKAADKGLKSVQTEVKNGEKYWNGQLKNIENKNRNKRGEAQFNRMGAMWDHQSKFGNRA
jgi:hypothetical protein